MTPTRSRRRGATATRVRRAVAVLVAAGVVALPSCGSSDSYVLDDCERLTLPGRSAAREWNEAILGAIRRDVPAPTVHSRNLFHLSAAMWDAWAAYDPQAVGYFVDEKHEADDARAAREAAISFAAYRLLLWRYAHAAGVEVTFEQLPVVMRSLCYDVDYTTTEGDSPAALGNRIAEAAIAYGLKDGAREEQRYVDPRYQPANEPLVVAEPGATMRDPNRWQPLALEELVSQNDIPLPGSVQSFIGPHWGGVRGFALPRSPDALPVDPGPPPQLGDPETDRIFKRQALDVIRYSSHLDPADGAVVDIGPGALGDNPLGANDGDGHEVNPETGEAYAPNRVLHADFGRAIAEHWADGPDSETPPGHWNVIANTVSDASGFEHRLGGDGDPLDRLEWDVKLYFALNGALHDAAVAAWGVKGYYDSVRPISMIRYMGGKGQSSDPSGPAYDPDGLPLGPGLVEVITRASSAPGQPHEHLADHVGEIAVRAWRGNPEDPAVETSGVGWIRAVEWVPYQRPTFVTPAFAGYVSGHSTFSRAGAEVMTAFTGSPFFPGGLLEHTVPQGVFLHEEGPTRDVTLQWATYFDAADQAGISRLYGGIHIAADDVVGRVMGAEIGRDAWSLARRYFEGSAG